MLQAHFILSLSLNVLFDKISGHPHHAATHHPLRTPGSPEGLISVDRGACPMPSASSVPNYDLLLGRPSSLDWKRNQGFVVPGSSAARAPCRVLSSSVLSSCVARPWARVPGLWLFPPPCRPVYFSTLLLPFSPVRQPHISWQSCLPQVTFTDEPRPLSRPFFLRPYICAKVAAPPSFTLAIYPSTLSRQHVSRGIHHYPACASH